MTPRKQQALFIGLFLLTSIPGISNPQKQFIKGIRHNRFFIVQKIKKISLPQNGYLFKTGKKVGEYQILRHQNSQILCQLNSNQFLLDEKCYIISKTKPDSKITAAIKKTALSSIRVDQFLFVKRDKIFISKEPVSLNHIGNVENLPDFLESIEKKTKSKYQANIPRAKVILQNPSHFLPAMVGKFIICNIQNRFGYAYLEEDEIITKPVLKATINKLKNKFYFYIVLK